MSYPHRPSTDHGGQIPAWSFRNGIEGISVLLDSWGPKNALLTMARYLDSNWGGEGNRPGDVADYLNSAAQGRIRKEGRNCDDPDILIQLEDLTEQAQGAIRACFAGQTLPQIKEMVTLAFTISGVTRAFTHQLVRTRIGAAFMQHGGRDNDWRNSNFRIPASIAANPEVRKAIERAVGECKQAYAMAADAGIPWQDARCITPIGTETYIHATYTYQTLSGLMGNRMCHCMQWEINYVAQRMVEQVRANLPAIFGENLTAFCDKTKVCNFTGDTWAPCQKYPKEWNQADYEFPPEANPFFVVDENGTVIQTEGIYPGADRNEVIGKQVMTEA